VIDHVMDAIEISKRVDLIEIIRQIREDRMALVQHTVQYKFACVSQPIPTQLSVPWLSPNFSYSVILDLFLFHSIVGAIVGRPILVPTRYCCQDTIPFCLHMMLPFERG
jgi:hypothetical protein